MKNREPLLGKDSFHDKIKEAVRQKIEAYADEEINRLCAEFRESLERKKSKVVGSLVAAIDIFTSYDIPDDRYVINVTFKK